MRGVREASGHHIRTADSRPLSDAGMARGGAVGARVRSTERKSVRKDLLSSSAERVRFGLISLGGPLQEYPLISNIISVL